MDSASNGTLNGWNVKYLQMRRQKYQQLQQMKKNQQIEEESKPIAKSVPVYRPIIDPQPIEHKTLSPQDAISNGLIIRVIERTLNANDYKVQCEYESETIELIASKEQIVKNNIIPLLDYYEKTLGLR